MLLEKVAECGVIGNNTGNAEVSIFCVSYNQKEYIEDALDGFIMQRTNFKYRVVIYDDASTDGTTEIIQRYAEANPDLICAYIATKNTFNHPRRRHMWDDFVGRVSRSKYVALCEGDDYWIDDNKLQLQYDYMENNPQCVLVMHNAMWEDCTTGTRHRADPFINVTSGEVSAEEAIMQYNAHPPTASFFMTKELIYIPEFVNDAPMGDYSLLLYALLKGEVHYIPRIMSVYRFKATNSYTLSLVNDEIKNVYFMYNALVFLHQFDRYSGYRFHKWCMAKEQTYAYGIIDKIDVYGGIEKMISLCVTKGYYIHRCQEIDSKLSEIYEVVYMNKLSPSVVDYFREHETVYIMGAGNFAANLVRKISAYKLSFEAFVVTSKKDTTQSFDKCIIELKELKDRKGYGVVIAISPRIWKEILEALEENNINDYICPYLFEMD